ncbi:hypothetical protein M0812_28430 [Anaeramoeba flamelloides]|uniref:AttH domain-containing protein n=1 Tax=Anaeramoeba flamelloides TaxID=1746091 RepID=A0AAV7Y838_9EUKA|nr:hypothetical protein M0812_28430 [Anaeramoeba flamelloides]
MNNKSILLIVLFFFLYKFAHSGPILDDGFVNPAPFWERFRESDFVKHKPFYQWWYYSLEDFEQKRTFFFVYSFSRCVKNMTNQGSYVLFGSVDHNSQHQHWQIIHKYPLKEFFVNNEFNVSIGNGKFKLEPISDGVIHLTGKLNDQSHLWYADNIDPNTEITWDLTLQRIQGWYGEPDIEVIDDFVGAIGWNTYAHDSLISGNIQVGNTHYKIEKSKRFRIYGDMNWGEFFPYGQGRDMAWGWYNIIIPSDNPSYDIAIIAGNGKTKTGSILGAMDASYCNAKVGLDRQGFRHVRGWDNTSHAIVWINTAGENEKLLDFTIDRTNWITITDKLGSSEIPLKQIVTIQSTKWDVSITCTSTQEMYNRLIFPTDGTIFSDWEALGVNAHVVIKKHATGEVIVDKTVDTAGLEFGYKCPIHF